MKTPSSSNEGPLWETARRLYDSVREHEDANPPSASSIDRADLAAEVKSLIATLLTELQRPTTGTIIDTERAQFQLTASQQISGMGGGAVDLLMPGDLRVIAPRFLPGIDRPVAVLLLDQDFETDQWTIVPCSPADQPVHEGEWFTDVDEPLLRVLCFWNARRVSGCVLENSRLLGMLSEQELAHCTHLHQTWADGLPWAEEDLARSYAASADDFDSLDFDEEEQSGLMSQLARVEAFRPASPAGAVSLLASASSGWPSHEQRYQLPGFGRLLSLRCAPDGQAEVVLGECTQRHVAKLQSPVLVTGVGTEYPLTEQVCIKVPAHELARGFWISVGHFGWTSLVAVPS